METHLDPYNDHSPSIVDLGTVRPMARRQAAVRVRRRERVDSPTTTVRHVLKAFSVTFVLVVLLGAKGIIQTARGMSNSPGQSIMLGVGNLGLSAEQILHLTWPWDDFQVAIGHPQQPTLPPLLQAPTATPTHNASNPAPPPRNGTHNGAGTANGKGATDNGKGKATKHLSKPKWPAMRPITKNHPLDLLITGDSLPGYMGPQILSAAAGQGPVVGSTDVHDGTGLTTPSFLDWSVEAALQVTQFHPDAIIMLLGGNDFENMTLPPSKAYPRGMFFPAGSTIWRREYERRAAWVMRTWIKAGVRRVYWLSLPPAQNASWAHDDYQINLALAAAAKEVPGVHYVNVLRPITNHGHYEAYVKVNGVPTLIREPDGVHLNIAGSQIVANEMVPIIKREWRFGWKDARRRGHHVTQQDLRANWHGTSKQKKATKS